MRAFPLFLILLVGLSGVHALAQVAPSQPKTVKSPFHGEINLDSPEGKDFAKLQELFGIMRADHAASVNAKNNGKPEDAAVIEAAYKESSKKFEDALDQYVRDWSGTLYPKDWKPAPPSEDPHMDQLSKQYWLDRRKAFALLFTNDKTVIPPEKTGPRGQQTKPSGDCNKGGGLTGPLETLACEENKK